MFPSWSIYLQEINGVTQILAETLFSRGDSLLEKSSTCSMDPLQLHAITMRLTKPDTVSKCLALLSGDGLCSVLNTDPTITSKLICMWITVIRTQTQLLVVCIHSTFAYRLLI